MAGDEANRLKFATSGPEKSDFSDEDRARMKEEAEAWRAEYASVKAEMLEVTREDLKIRAR